MALKSADYVLVLGERMNVRNRAIQIVDNTSVMPVTRSTMLENC